MRHIWIASAVLSATVFAAASPAWAQATAITRTELQKVEAPDANHVVASYLVTIAPHGVVPRHTHPGVEMGYLLSGGGTVSVQGAPDRTVKPGDSWAFPAGVPHSLHNTGSKPEKLIATYVVEKDRPLSTPAP
jgi:quercetin dioxygenase-like cupin family protein